MPVASVDAGHAIAIAVDDVPMVEPSFARTLTAGADGAVTSIAYAPLRRRPLVVSPSSSFGLGTPELMSLLRSELTAVAQVGLHVQQLGRDPGDVRRRERRPVGDRVARRAPRDARDEDALPGRGHVDPRPAVRERGEVAARPDGGNREDVRRVVLGRVEVDPDLVARGGDDQDIRVLGVVDRVEQGRGRLFGAPRGVDHVRALVDRVLDRGRGHVGVHALVVDQPADGHQLGIGRDACHPGAVRGGRDDARDGGAVKVLARAVQLGRRAGGARTG